MKKAWNTRIVAMAVVGVTAIAARAAEPVKPDQFDHLRAVIKPQKGEDKWAGIPWKTDLWEARKQAAAQGKPILLWEMDGHPLGCG
jgi:hypothetical protein